MSNILHDFTPYLEPQENCSLSHYSEKPGIKFAHKINEGKTFEAYKKREGNSLGSQG